jgi:hypothetical protein
MTAQLVQLQFSGRPSIEGFGAIRASMPPQAPVQVLDPLRLPTGAADYAGLGVRTDLLLDEIGAGVATSYVIQAECTAALLALALAARIGAGGPAVLVQLFNPEVVGDCHVQDTFCELADKLGAGPAQSRRAVAEYLETIAEPARLLRTLRDALTDLGVSFARTLGVPAEQAADFGLELIDRYTGWLNFLIASNGSRADLPRPDGCEIRLYRTRECPPAAAWSGARERCYDGPHAAMRCPDLVADVIADLAGSALR